MSEVVRYLIVHASFPNDAMVRTPDLEAAKRTRDEWNDQNECRGKGRPYSIVKETITREVVDE